MDFSTATEIVRTRVQEIEPALANKVIGYLLLKEFSALEMIRLAFGPDCVIASLVEEAKYAIPGVVSCTPSTATIHVPSSQYWESQVVADQPLPIRQVDYISLPHANPFGVSNLFQLEENGDNGNVMWGEMLSNGYYNQEAQVGCWEGSGLRSGRRSVGFPESQAKACHYFFKGYCKHGTNCRYFHGHSLPDSFFKNANANLNDAATNEESNLSPTSLEKLEVEITDLLRLHGDQGISIAMLPLLYFEKYGKHLQAEGYLTESQRHGKAGYSLTRLLARLKSSIRIIDRPHGQHSVVLAEYAARLPEFKSGEMGDPGSGVTGSQQIYLTFPAESTFTEDDVSNYFNQFGAVHAVRIPPQQKRMFGFVTFMLPETVKRVLSQGNPHYVCGARVLAKPYREKSRKCNDKVEIPMYHSSQHLEVQVPRTLDNGVKRQVMEEPLALQMRRLRGLRLAPRQLAQRRYLACDMEEASLLEGGDEALSPDYLGAQPELDPLKYNAVSEDKSRSSCTNCSHQEGQIDLPESPFESPCIGSRISTLV